MDMIKEPQTLVMLDKAVEPRAGMIIRIIDDSSAKVVENHLPAKLKKLPENAEVCLPLKHVACSSTIHESLSHVAITYNFVNPCPQPLELTFRLPKLESMIVSRLEISVGDQRVIEARVAERQKAEEKYDDAVAAGHTAVKMEESKKTESYELNLGNVQPN